MPNSTMKNLEGETGAIDPQWAWEPYVPKGSMPWTSAAAAHLLRRAAFSATHLQLEEAVKAGPEKTIDRLLQPQGDVAAFQELYDDYEKASAGSIEALQAWWLRRLIDTPDPLHEKLTLFWHGHFACSNDSVGSSAIMLDHVRLLRRHALGSFAEMLDAVATDPVFLLSRKADQNRKAIPNLYFAEQFLQLTLGSEACTEHDSEELARAFTGWFVFQFQTRYIEREHDTGDMTLFGSRGNLDASKAVQLVLQHPEAARQIVRSMYRLLISETVEPDDQLIRPLADAFAADYDIRSLVGRMLRSNLFFSPMAYRQKAKSPIDYALGIVRPLQGRLSTETLSRWLTNLGQQLYYPPTTRGWAGGRDWLNSATFIGRSNLAMVILSGSKPLACKCDPESLARENGCSSTQAAARFYLELFLQSDIEPETKAKLDKLAADNSGSSRDRLNRVIHAVLTLPEFHLA